LNPTKTIKGRLKQRPQPIRKRTGTPKMAIYQSGVIFDQVDTANPDCWTLDEYVKRGGYSALRRILSENISQTDVIDEVKASGRKVWRISQEKLSEAEYRRALKNIAPLNTNGMLPNEQNLKTDTFKEIKKTVKVITKVED